MLDKNYVSRGGRVVDLLSAFVITACKQRRRVYTQLKCGVSEIHIRCGESVADFSDE